MAKERKTKPKHYVEYAALRLFSATFNVLPYRVALTLAWLFARFAFHVIRFRRSRADARMVEVFGDRYSAKERRRFAWISMRNMFFNAVEVMRLGKVDRAWVQKHTECSDALARMKAVTASSGAIIAIPHMGSWDLSGVSGQLLGLPTFFITGRQHNPLTDAYMNRQRGRSGAETIPRGDATMLRQVIRNLKSGKVLAFMTDLRSRREGVKVQFLGKEANVVAGMAMFARQAKVPICPVVVRRVGWARHTWEAFDPVTADESLEKAEDFVRMTQAVMDVYDKAIRAEPEQYFWYNNRWILFPFDPESGSNAEAMRAKGMVVNK